MENKNQAHNYAIITLVFGILSIILMFFGWGAIIGLGCGVAAIIFANQTKKASSEKETMALIGLICGIIGIVLSIIAIISLVIVMGIYVNEKNETKKIIDSAQKNINEAKEKIETKIDEYDTNTSSEKKETESEKSTQNSTTEGNSNSTQNSTTEDNNNSTQNSTTESSVNPNAEKIANLEQQLNEKNKELESKKGSVTDLNTRMQSAILNGQADQISSFRDEITNLNREISTLITEILSLNSQIQALK